MSDLLSCIRTGAWLDAQTFPPLSWAVPGIIPEGFGLFTGPPKAGKSWATLGLALAVSSGSDAFGKVPVGPPRPVLLLALEDGYRRLQDRCRRLLNGAPIPELLHHATSAPAGDVFNLISEWLDLHAHDRPLVILDTLGKVAGPALPGEGAYGRDYRIGGWLKKLSDTHPGTSLVVVHHVRKASSEDWMDSTSGTNGLNGSADFTVSLSRSRNTDEGILRVTGRDVPEGEYALTVSDGTWTLNGSSLADAARAAEQARATEGLGNTAADVVQYVNNHPVGARSAEVAEALGISETTARQYLRRAEQAGRISKATRGLYTPVTSVTSVTSDGGENAERDTCDGCDTPLDAWLIDAGETAHIGCSS
jgi:hypothetical protein